MIGYLYLGMVIGCFLGFVFCAFISTGKRTDMESWVRRADPFLRSDRQALMARVGQGELTPKGAEDLARLTELLEEIEG